MKYRVIKRFIDKYDNSIIYEVGDVIELSKDRAIEILKVDKLIEKVKTKKQK